MADKQQPVMNFKAGSVRAAIFENRVSVNGKTAIVFKATVSKSFKDRKTGERQGSASFTRDEVALAVHCLQKCYAAMIDEQNVNSGLAVTEEEIAA
jgi:hypothetical protein